MNKSEFIYRISCILSRGQGHDTSYFAQKDHDGLVDEFIAYLELNANYFPAWTLTKSHALNESGVDILLESEVAKAGFQIKSHFDVTEKDFASKVKRQTLESFQHGLDKYYVLICSPLEHDGDSLEGKVSHLFNELSKLKTRYLAAYTPASTICYFNPPTEMPDEEFNAAIQKISFEKTDFDLLRQMIEHKNDESARPSLFDRVEVKQTVAAKTLDAFDLAEHLDGEELEQAISEIGQLLELIADLPYPSREFLCLTLERAKPDRFHERMRVLTSEIESRLNMSPHELKREVDLLESYDLAYIDFDDFNPAEIVIKSRCNFVNSFEEIKRICAERGVDLRQVLCELDFSVLD